jgi:hypothetical protein
MPPVYVRSGCLLANRGKAASDQRPPFTDRLFGRLFYSDEERVVLDNLELALIEFVSCFQGLPRAAKKA